MNLELYKTKEVRILIDRVCFPIDTKNFKF